MESNAGKYIDHMNNDRVTKVNLDISSLTLSVTARYLLHGIKRWSMTQKITNLNQYRTLINQRKRKGRAFQREKP